MHIFHVPSSVFVAGSSGSGKTTLVRKIVQNLDKMTDQHVDRIYWHYSISAKNLPVDIPGVELRTGTPDPDELLATPGYKCVIIDDALGHFMKNERELVDLFTKVVSHTNTLLFLIVQSLFALNRTARANSQYILLTRSSGDKLQIRTLAHQIFPECPKFLLESYDDSVYGTSYGHLLLDLHPLTEKDLRVVGNILDQEHTVYIPKRKAF